MGILERLFETDSVKRKTNRMENYAEWCFKLRIASFDDRFVSAARLAEERGLVKKAIILYAKSCIPICIMGDALGLAKENDMNEMIPLIYETAAKYSRDLDDKANRIEDAAWHARRLGMIKEAENYEKKYKTLTGEQIDYNNLAIAMLHGIIPREFLPSKSN